MITSIIARVHQHQHGLPNPSINWDSAALTESWARFKQHSDLMFSGPMSDKTGGHKVSYHLLWVGERGRDIHSTLTFRPAQAEVAATDTEPAIPADPGEDPNNY